MRVMKADELDSSSGRETLFCEHLNQYIGNYNMGEIVENRQRSLFIFNKRKK